MSAERKKRIVGMTCCVVGCFNTKGKNPDLKFYSFPSANQDWKQELRMKWINAVKRKNPDNTPWQPKKSSYICSKHFVGGKKSNIAAHPAYVPTIFPDVYKQQKTNVNALSRYKRVDEKKALDIFSTKKSECLQQLSDVAKEIIVENNLTSLPTIVKDDLIVTPKEFNTIAVQTDDTLLDESYVETSYFMCNRETSGLMSTAEVQVSLASKKCIKIDAHNKSRGFYGFSSIDSGEKMNFLAGVTFEVFNLLLKVLPKSKSMKISKENKLLIFLMKMKLGLTFASLSVIFDVHQTSISRTFLSVLDALQIGLEDFVRWPSRPVVEHLLPDSFKKNYPKCRAIIDCTEIRIEHPSSIEQQVQTYSNYKSSQTVKFLIACTPDGFISFVSHCYGGRASDGFITVDSGFLDLIEPGDVIMADKGFPTIRTDVENKNAIFVMPPFAFNEQFTQDEMSLTYKIASVRIHIERCIQRVKLFRITHFLPHELVPHCDKIVHICCALVNLQPPIIKS